MWPIPQFLSNPYQIWSSCDRDSNQETYRGPDLQRQWDTCLSWIFMLSRYRIPFRKSAYLATKMMTIFYQFQAASTTHGNDSFSTFLYCLGYDANLLRLVGMWQNGSERFWQEIACLGFHGIPEALTAGSFTSHKAASLFSESGRQRGHLRDLRETPQMILDLNGAYRSSRRSFGGWKVILSRSPVLSDLTRAFEMYGGVADWFQVIVSSVVGGITHGKACHLPVLMKFLWCSWKYVHQYLKLNNWNSWQVAKK